MTTAAPNPALVLHDFLTSRDPFAIIAARHGLTLAGLRAVLDSPDSRAEIEAFHALTRLRRARAADFARTGAKSVPPAAPAPPSHADVTRIPTHPRGTGVPPVSTTPPRPHSSPSQATLQTTPSPSANSPANPTPSTPPRGQARIAAAMALRSRIRQNAAAAGLTPAALHELAGISPTSAPLPANPRAP